MEEKLKRRMEYLERNYRYLTEDEKWELDELRAMDTGGSGEYDSDYFDSDPEWGSSQETLPQKNRKRAGLSLRKSRDEGEYRDEREYQESEPEEFQRGEKPPKKARKKKRGLGRKIRNLFLLLLLLMAGFFAYGYYRVKNTPAADFKTEEFNGTKTKNGATNILILGTDQRDFWEDTDARSDSIMVLQLGAPDKKIKLVSFMRDSLVHIPGYSPEGYEDNKLNVAFTLGEQEGHRGAELMRQTLKEAYDLDIEYYAMVNFSSFAEVVNSLFPGGVKNDAQFSTVDGEAVSEVSVPDDLNWTPEHQDPVQIIHTGVQKMDGRTLLNYARFRKDDEGDYGRTRRQQQVMAAIISQAKNPAVLFTGPSAIGTIKALTGTNVPDSFMLAKSLPTLLNAKNGIESFTVPELGDWVDVQDRYGGAALEIDFPKYQELLRERLGQ